jgi:hypothetical protein
MFSPSTPLETIQSALFLHNLKFRLFYTSENRAFPYPEDLILLLHQTGEGSIAQLVDRLVGAPDAGTQEMERMAAEIHSEDSMARLAEGVRAMYPSLEPGLKDELELLLNFPQADRAEDLDLELAARVDSRTVGYYKQGTVTRRECRLRVGKQLLQGFRRHLPDDFTLYASFFPGCFLGRRTVEEKRAHCEVVAVDGVIGSVPVLGWTRPENASMLAVGPIRFVARHRDMQPYWLFHCSDMIEVRSRLLVQLYGTEASRSRHPFLIPLLEEALGPDRSVWLEQYRAYEREAIVCHELGHHLCHDRTEFLIHGEPHLPAGEVAHATLIELLADRHSLEAIQKGGEHDWTLIRAFEGIHFHQRPDCFRLPEEVEHLGFVGSFYYILRMWAVWKDDPLSCIDELEETIVRFARESSSREEYHDRMLGLAGEALDELARIPDLSGLAAAD